MRRRGLLVRAARDAWKEEAARCLAPEVSFPCPSLVVEPDSLPGRDVSYASLRFNEPLRFFVSVCI